jgi:hypothetical protein
MKFFTIADIAELCKISKKSVWRAIKANHLHARKVAGQWISDEADLQNFINRYQNFIIEGAVTVPGQIESNQSGQSQVEAKPVTVNIDNEKSATPGTVDSEDADITETIKNAELHVAHWNIFSPTKCHNRNVHLYGLVKDKTEKLMFESNNDLKSNLLSVRIFFYLHDQKLIKGIKALPLTDYIKRNYHLIYNYPQLTTDEEEDLDQAMKLQVIHCLSCKKLTRTPGPLKKYGCPKCGEPKDIEIEYHAIKDEDMEEYPVLKKFDDQYHDILKRSQKQVQARKREDEMRWIKEMQLDKRYLSPEENSNMLDWSIVGDIYDLKNAVYDPEYLKRLGIGE